MSTRTWTLSNILSLSRAILTLPIVLLLLSEVPDYRYWAVGVMAAATLTDLFDGMLARALHQETELGKILDPLADKIAVVSITTVLAVQQVIPLWFLIVVIARDLLILSGGMYLKKTKNVVLQSNTAGKWAVMAIAAYIVAATLELGVEFILMWISTLMLGISFALYFVRFNQVVRQG